METRKCNKCNIVYDKTKEFYHKRKTSPDGWNTICKNCIKFSKPRVIKHWDNDKLLCLTCNVYKSVDEFFVDNKKVHRRYKCTKCKKCKSIHYEKRKLQNRGKRDLDRLLLERWHGVKDRAKKKGLIMNFEWIYLKELWIKQNGLCVITGLPMTYTMCCGRVSTNVSVDRIDSTKGYIKENIQLICMAVNQMKSDLSLSELFFFCSKILKNNNYES